MLKKMIFFLCLALLIIVTPLAVFSQGGSDIYLIQIRVDGGKYVFKDPVKVNQTGGYNNQPSFHPDGGSLFYSSESGPNTDIYRYDIKTGKTQPIVPMLKGNGFYAWTSSSALIMGVGEKLFEFKPGEDKDWRLIGDFSALGIKNISRLAIDPKTQWLAIVNSQ